MSSNLESGEVGNALFLYQRHGLMSATAIKLALNAALSLPLHLHGDAALHTRAVDQAGQFSLSATYDAHYLALAERVGGESWTSDQRLARAVQKSLPWVRLLETG